MDDAPKEIELKLRIAPEDLAILKNDPRLADALRDPTHQTLDSVYFDSDDHALRDNGVTLRVRQFGGRHVQTIKAADNASYSIERSEWERDIDSDQPDLAGVEDTPLAPVLTADVRATLKPVFETRIERTAYRLSGNDSAIDVAVDEGQIVGSDGSCPIAEIELELKHGHPAELFKVARTISGIVPARLDVKSKPERGYELIGNVEPGAELARNAALDSEVTAGRAFTLIGRACVRHLVANEPATMLRHGEALHQMRIAVRRLRAAISLFADVIRDERMEAVKSELRWFARELGPARDLDAFMLEVLKPLRAQHKDDPGFVSMSKMFARRRLEAHRRARAAVQSARFRNMVLDTAEWIEAGPWAVSDDPVIVARREVPAALFGSAQLSRRRKKIRRRGAGMDRLNPEARHQLRIQVKKARYAVEFFAGVFDGRKAAKRRKVMSAELRAMQDSLGGLNDIATRKVLCSELIADPPRGLNAEQSRHRSFAAGLIIGHQEARAGDLLKRAQKAHARFAKAKVFWKSGRVPVPAEPAEPQPAA